jgi:hypothetical protein
VIDAFTLALPLAIVGLLVLVDGGKSIRRKP